MKIITHRGLDPSKGNYFIESSLEAFTDQLSRGYGLEFDLQITKDNKVIILHDSTLKHISEGKDERTIRDIDLDELLAMEFSGNHLISFDKILDLVQEKQSLEALSAIHLKYTLQNKNDLDTILSYLKNTDTGKFIIFDVKIDTAKYLKEHNSKLALAPSVSLPYDIKRYNTIAGGTLLSVEETLENKNLFSAVWLDEWDLTDENNKLKKLYTAEIFKIFHDSELKIGLVTPELHNTSPNLLGGEKHPDAKTFESLTIRLKEIIALNPDMVCTDHPDTVKYLITEKI